MDIQVIKVILENVTSKIVGDVMRVMIEKIFEKKLNRKLTTEEKQLIFKYKANINTVINKSKFSTITKDNLLFMI